MNYYHQERMNEEGVEFVPNAWSSELPADILGLITDKIRSLPLPEFIRFGSVCLGWRSFSIENYQHIKSPDKVPLLLIPIPPSLLLADHQKGILSPPPPPPSLIEEEEEEEEEEEGKEEENPSLLADHQKGILSPPPPPPPPSLIEEEEEEEEEEEGKEEEKGEEKVEEEEEDEIEIKIKIKIEIEIEKEIENEVEEEEENDEKEKDEDEDEDEEEEEEDDHDDKEEFNKWANYYSPNEIWEGQDAKQRYESTRTFYSLSEKRVYHDFQLPVPYYKNILGSSYGWLVTVQECYADNGQLYLPVSLFNPFRTYNNEIHLPPITKGNPGDLEKGETIKDSYFLNKAFLSANPSSLSDPTTQLVVLGVYGRNRLAFCRPGDISWTRLDLEDYRPIQDIICYQDQFFAVLQNGYVFAFVFDAAQLLPTPIVTLGFSPPPNVRVSNITYLVESGGDLLLVLRYLYVGCPTAAERPIPVEEDIGYITRKFLVFKLDTTGEWVEMKTLNDRMLFIGTSSSMSLSASNFPGWSRPNSVYYTDDYSDFFVTKPHTGPHDIGIFNLEDGSFERHYEAESKIILPSPIWIQPML